jgi:hypothetical protein
MGMETKKLPKSFLKDRELKASSTGLEPATSGSTVRRSNQLSYEPVSFCEQNITKSVGVLHPGRVKKWDSIVSWMNVNSFGRSQIIPHRKSWKWSDFVANTENRVNIATTSKLYVSRNQGLIDLGTESANRHQSIRRPTRTNGEAHIHGTHTGATLSTHRRADPRGRTRFMSPLSLLRSFVTA